MTLTTSQIQLVRNAFQSILRADYISVSEIAQLESLDKYYVDYFKNLPKVLNDQDSYINGRRGSGKTVLLMRAYYECLKTVSPKVKIESPILQKKKVLPIYIDLSQCKDIFSDDDACLEESFISKLVAEFQRQLKTIFEEHFFKCLSKDFSQMDEFAQIQSMLMEGILFKSTAEDIAITSSCEIKDSTDLNIGSKGMNLSAGMVDFTSYQQTAKIKEKRGVSVQDFLAFLGTIRKQSRLDAIYIFIDEFSDLSENEQNKFSLLLKKLLGSKNNIFFKVGTITDRFYFGESIIVGRDIYPISLDLNDFVERYGGITLATKELLRFTHELIEKRLQIYANGISMDEIFKENKQEMVSRISREAMGVPRTIGLILQNAFMQAETRQNVALQLSDINIGIRETRKIYFKQFQGAIQKRIIPGYYMDMWNSLLKKALDEKKRNPGRPASHFMLDAVRKKYLNVFCENFMVHCLEDSRASKYGGNYVLFAFDYDICNDNNISYADEKDEFTAVRFIYDSILQNFDGYFSKDRIKSYRCPECNKIYEEAEVAMMKKKKRCFECDCELEEIIHCEIPISDGNYTEVEIKILGIIATLKNEQEAMSAAQISDAVGCSYQKVSNWCSKVLQKKNLISVTHKGGKNYYYDCVEEDSACIEG